MKTKIAKIKAYEVMMKTLLEITLNNIENLEGECVIEATLENGTKTSKSLDIKQLVIILDEQFKKMKK